MAINVVIVMVRRRHSIALERYAPVTFDTKPGTKCLPSEHRAALSHLGTLFGAEIKYQSASVVDLRHTARRTYSNSLPPEVSHTKAWHIDSID